MSEKLTERSNMSLNQAQSQQQPSKTVRLYHIGRTSQQQQYSSDLDLQNRQRQASINSNTLLQSLYSQYQNPFHYQQQMQQSYLESNRLGSSIRGLKGQPFDNENFIIYDKKNKCYYKIEDDYDDEDSDEDSDETEQSEEDETEEESVEETEEDETEEESEEETKDKIQEETEQETEEESEAETPRPQQSVAVAKANSTEESKISSNKDLANKSLTSVGSDGELRKSTLLKNHAIKGTIKKVVEESEKIEIVDDADYRILTIEKARRLSSGGVSYKSNKVSENESNLKDADGDKLPTTDSVSVEAKEFEDKEPEDDDRAVSRSPGMQNYDEKEPENDSVSPDTKDSDFIKPEGETTEYSEPEILKDFEGNKDISESEDGTVQKQGPDEQVVMKSSSAKVFDVEKEEKDDKELPSETDGDKKNETQESSEPKTDTGTTKAKLTDHEDVLETADKIKSTSSEEKEPLNKTNEKPTRAVTKSPAVVSPSSTNKSKQAANKNLKSKSMGGLLTNKPEDPGLKKKKERMSTTNIAGKTDRLTAVVADKKMANKGKEKNEKKKPITPDESVKLESKGNSFSIRTDEGISNKQIDDKVSSKEDSETRIDSNAEICNSSRSLTKQIISELRSSIEPRQEPEQELGVKVGQEVNSGDAQELSSDVKQEVNTEVQHESVVKIDCEQKDDFEADRRRDLEEGKKEFDALDDEPKVDECEPEILERSGEMLASEAAFVTSKSEKTKKDKSKKKKAVEMLENKEFKKKEEKVDEIQMAATQVETDRQSVEENKKKEAREEDGEDEDEADNYLKEKFLKEKQRQERRDQKRRERRAERRRKREENQNEENQDEEDGLPKIVYYDFEANKKSSGVFLHNLIEEPEEDKDSERKKDKSARTKKLRSVTQRLSLDSQNSDPGDLSVIHEQQSSLSDIRLPDINAQKPAVGESMQLSGRSRSKKLVALSVLKGADVNSVSKQMEFSERLDDQEENKKVIRLSKTDPRYEDLMSRVSIDDNENITYHKLPKKVNSKSEVSNKKSSRRKDKARSPSKTSKKSKKNSGEGKKSSGQDKISDAEFKKLEEQVKNKFPELFADEKLFLKKKTTALISAKLDHSSPYHPLNISRPVTGNSRLTSAKTLSNIPNGLTSVLSTSSGKDSALTSSQHMNIKKFYDPCYKRCRCLKHAEVNKDHQHHQLPSRDYWNDHAQYEQIFGENFIGHFPHINSHSKSCLNPIVKNQSRILTTTIYSDDTNNMTSIKLKCNCGYLKNKEPWNY